jgi:succinyl-CoA synthetase beta subunit
MKKTSILNDYKAEKFLSKHIPVAKSQLVKRGEEIRLKTPLVLKIISDQALHKTDIGGVKIVKSEMELTDSFNSLLSIAKRRRLKLDGVLVQEFHSGEQLIIGIKKDPVFGHVILFGLGGIFTEVLEDTSIRKCPISKFDALEMINELKAAKIFHGFRGKKLNLEILVKTLVAVSKLPEKHKKIKELDINPFMLNDKKGVVVDARIVFN